MNRLIVAIDRKRGLAKHGYMPWNIPEDEQFFTDQTKTHGGNVLTGGATFRLAYLSQPLVDRQNFILTRADAPIEGATVVHDLEKFLSEFGQDLWVSGGSQVFELIMGAGRADELYITHVDADFGCDQFFPEYEHDFELVEDSQPRQQNGFHFTYARYVRKSTST